MNRKHVKIYLVAIFELSWSHISYKWTYKHK